MKIVLNKRFGGFSISRACAEWMAERGSAQAQRELETDRTHWYGYGYSDQFPNGYDRTDPLLVDAVETLGDAANGPHAALRVVEIPDGIDWEMDNYDGVESVHEKHRSW